MLCVHTCVSLVEKGCVLIFYEPRTERETTSMAAFDGKSLIRWLEVSRIRQSDGFCLMSEVVVMAEVCDLPVQLIKT